MSRYPNANECTTAVRVVACPSCMAEIGQRCRLLRFKDARVMTVTHKRRVDAYYQTYAEFARRTLADKEKPPNAR